MRLANHEMVSAFAIKGPTLSRGLGLPYKRASGDRKCACRSRDTSACRRLKARKEDARRAGLRKDVNLCFEPCADPITFDLKIMASPQIQPNCSDVPKYRASRSAVSAVTARLPCTISLMRRGGTLIR